MHESIKLLIETLKLKPDHFQNKNMNGKTELFWLYDFKMNETIVSIKNWKPEHCNSDIERKYMKKYNFI